MLRILGRKSSINVRKALWAAAEVGAPFTHEDEWGNTRDLCSPEFLELNPNGMIPVVVTKDGPIWESNSICRFLARSANRSDLLPTEPFAGAQVEMWMDWQATELNSAWRPAFMALMRNHTLEAAAVQRSIRTWNAMMMILERHLSVTNAYVVGQSFTLADIPLALSVQRWILSPIPRPAAPALIAYWENLIRRPAAQAWIDPSIP